METSPITIPVFKIRASAIGTIMTSPERGKSVAERVADLTSDVGTRQEKIQKLNPGTKAHDKALEMIERKKTALALLIPRLSEPRLSKTCITFLRKWVDEHIYQRRVEFTSKQTDKGNIVERDAINYAAINIPEMGLVSKNQVRFKEHEYITGEPDVMTATTIYDTKCSWTHETFPLYSPELEETNYEWQVLGYMEIAERKRGFVVFVLMSMPEEMIIREARWKLPQDYSREEFEAFAAQFRYDDLPAYLRLKTYEVSYDEERIQAIKDRVLECRKYIDTVIMPEVEKNYHIYKEV